MLQTIPNEREILVSQGFRSLIGFNRFRHHYKVSLFISSLIDPLPNSYIFTKRLSELLIAEYEGKVPLIITRPTIG